MKQKEEFDKLTQKYKTKSESADNTIGSQSGGFFLFFFKYYQQKSLKNFKIRHGWFLLSANGKESDDGRSRN